MKPITFLSDYGHDDHFVGSCHGVIAQIAPETRVIDITHTLPSYQVAPAAVTLRSAIPYLPVGVHLAVVDPGVGSERGAVAFETADGRLFVGPDNGTLWPAAELCGEVITAVDIRHTPVRLEPTSATFHGRDIFAPVAAHLSAGTPVSELGDPFNPANLCHLELPVATVRDAALHAHVLQIDHYGNVQLDGHAGQLAELAIEPGRSVEITIGGRSFPAAYGRTFSDVSAGELLLYEDSSRQLAVAANQDSASRWLAASAGASVTISTDLRSPSRD